MQDLKVIRPRMPSNFNNYYEPFVGGGAVWLNVYANHYYINDISQDLINLYKLIKNKNKPFIVFIKNISQLWKLNDISKQLKSYPIKTLEDVITFDNQIADSFFKLSRFIGFNKKHVVKQLIKSTTMKYKHLLRKKANNSHMAIQNQSLNVLTGIKTAIYTLLRSKYNTTTHSDISHIACYWFLREYGYSSMFRFNRHGDFNIPYGGMSYNKKNIITKLNLALSNNFQKHLHKTTLFNTDFAKMMNAQQPQKNDFVFLDPPYDTKFSTYDKHPFGKSAQIRLAKYLKYHLNAYFMMVIQNTPLISKLYQQNELVLNNRKLKIRTVGRRYSVNFKNRNLKEQHVKYLIITNY